VVFFHQIADLVCLRELQPYWYAKTDIRWVLQSSRSRPLRFVRYLSEVGPTFGVLDDKEAVIPLYALFEEALASRPALGISREFIDLALNDARVFLASLDIIRTALDEASDVVDQLPTETEKLGELHVLPFVDAPEKVIGVSYNYRTFKKQEGIEDTPVPQVFPKTPSSILGARMPVRVPSAITHVDFEAEVGVIIGITARRVGLDQAARCIAGYTALNEMTAKILPRPKSDLETIQLRLKGIDNFCPMGPVVVTSDEWEGMGREIHVNCKVNGEQRQHYPAYDWVHSPAEVISFVSGFMTLRPGDVLSMGTSSGVGIADIPPRLLKDGDVVEVWIDGIPGTKNVIRFVSQEARP
jgi:2-keto-4-pentenoate hydratase/2-oxohepta-3-ene-1,7-dioic acid hydratase in catechol pathway